MRLTDFEHHRPKHRLQTHSQLRSNAHILMLAISCHQETVKVPLITTDLPPAGRISTSGADCHPNLHCQWFFLKPTNTLNIFRGGRLTVSSQLIFFTSRRILVRASIPPHSLLRATTHSISFTSRCTPGKESLLASKCSCLLMRKRFMFACWTGRE